MGRLAGQAHHRAPWRFIEGLRCGVARPGAQGLGGAASRGAWPLLREHWECGARKTSQDGVAMADSRLDGLADHGILSPSPAEAASEEWWVMPVRHYRKDPRTLAERRADDSVRGRFEQGRFLEVDAAVERDAIAHVQRRYQARRETVASLGRELGVLRRAHGLTQTQVAIAMGTKKSNISRLESGRYGGLTIEYFMAIIDAFRALDRGSPRASTGRRRLGHMR